MSLSLSVYPRGRCYALAQSSRSLRLRLAELTPSAAHFRDFPHRQGQAGSCSRVDLPGPGTKPHPMQAARPDDAYRPGPDASKEPALVHMGPRVCRVPSPGKPTLDLVLRSLDAVRPPGAPGPRLKAPRGPGTKKRPRSGRKHGATDQILCGRVALPGFGAAGLDRGG